MNNYPMNKDFLYQLLSTPSPSGAEWNIQKIWKNYVAPFADSLQTDIGGNVIAILNPEAPFKVMLTGHCDEIGFIINYIDDKGFLYFAPVGHISHKIAPGMKVTILGSGGTLTGIVGVPAEHLGGLKKDFQFEDLYIDCGAKNKEEIQRYVNVGDFVVYKRSYEELLNNRLTARALDDKTGAFIVAEVLRHLSENRPNPSVGVYIVSTVSEEVGLHGAYFAGAGIQPNLAIACDVTFALDHPDINPKKYGDIQLDKGPVLAKGAPINPKLNALLQQTAQKYDIPIQYELTPRATGTDADKMRFTGKGIPVALVSLPLRYMHSPVETVSFDDIQSEITLLVEMIRSLSGTENFHPLED